MRFFDMGQEANGFIAVGQIATGVFAFGQMATGVVAVGQVARGVFVVGQGAIGVVCLGMGSAGLAVSVGMVGVGGRGLGLVLPLTPSLGPSYALPELVSPATLSAEKDEGWVRATVVPEPPHLELPGQPLRLDARWRQALAAFSASGRREVLARVQRRGGDLIAVELMAVPSSRLRSPRWWLIWLLQCAGLVALAGVVLGVALLPILALAGIRVPLP